jgi:hypothetical protein
MAQNFLPCDRDQELLLPPSLREWLPEDHLAWFVLDAVAELGLEPFYASYRRDGWGAAAHVTPDEVLRHGAIVLTAPDETPGCSGATTVGADDAPTAALQPCRRRRTRLSLKRADPRSETRTAPPPQRCPARNRAAAIGSPRPTPTGHAPRKNTSAPLSKSPNANPPPHSKTQAAHPTRVCATASRERGRGRGDGVSFSGVPRTRGRRLRR